VAAGLGLAPAVRAQPPVQTLPYGARTRAFNGLSTFLTGDLRTVGTAGAIGGIGDSFFGSYDNPAGLAMTLGDGGLFLGGNIQRDAFVQNFDNPFSTYTLGGFSPQYPWGWAVSLSNLHSEGTRYFSPVTGETMNAQVFTREVRASLARTFWDHRLSIGASLILGQGVRSLEFEPDAVTGLRSPSTASLTYTAGASLGFLFQLPRRWFLGLAGTSPLTYPGELDISITQFPGFYQEIVVPWRLTLGTGWIPNRIFRFGASLQAIGISSRASLLSDQNRSVGATHTVQPRLGAYYRAIEFKELVLEVMLGSYMEFSRIEGLGVRPHLTAAVELKPWIFILGAGIDFAHTYQNIIYAVGVDVGKLFRKLDLFPPLPHPPYAGFVPSPFRIFDEGLPRPINPSWQPPEGPSQNVIDIGKALPVKVKEKLEDTIQDIKGETMADVKAKKKKKAASKSPSKRPRR
jgi:hypothetical protein